MVSGKIHYGWMHVSGGSLPATLKEFQTGGQKTILNYISSCY